MSQYVNCYARGKFSEARGYMAKSSGSLKDRVGGAYLGWLFVVRDDDLPDDLRVDFQTLKALLTTEPPDRWRGSVDATLAKMHWRKVRKCADLIVTLADDADRRIDPVFDYRSAA